MKTLLTGLLACCWLLVGRPVHATASLAADTLVRVAANPTQGFNYPYFLLVPKHTPRQLPLCLMVEPNNTGTTNDTLAVHERAARQAVTGPHRCLGGDLARDLAVPLLVPVFPRPARQELLYTHALDKDALHAQGEMKRLDEQLLHMIDNAQARLRALQIAVQPPVLLNGFSASATFVNRFTLLHPGRVRAVAGGGLNGLLMLPVPQVQQHALPYPLGTADFAQLTGQPFSLAQYQAVPQFFYMGALDDNDAATYDDAYDDGERQLIYRYLGRRMQPDRWAFCQQVYQQQHVQATFKTYPGIGHGTDMTIYRDLVAFFKAHQ